LANLEVMERENGINNKRSPSIILPEKKNKKHLKLKIKISYVHDQISS
jgi:hypothetical protein